MYKSYSNLCTRSSVHYCPYSFRKPQKFSPAHVDWRRLLGSLNPKPLRSLSSNLVLSLVAQHIILFRTWVGSSRLPKVIDFLRSLVSYDTRSWLDVLSPETLRDQPPSLIWNEGVQPLWTAAQIQSQLHFPMQCDQNWGIPYQQQSEKRSSHVPSK